MWAFVRTVFAALGLLVSVAGLLTFVVLAIGVWWAKAETNRRTDALAARANAATDSADHAVAFVSGVVGQAETDLKRARENTAGVPPEPAHPIVKIGVQQTSQELAGSVDRASAAVITASDAVVVANTALELFDKDEKLQSWFGVTPEHLAQTRTDLGAATRDLKRARTFLGIPVAPGSTPTPEQLNAVEGALTQARAFTDQMGAVVANTRTRVAETKQRVDTWVRRAAIVITLLGVLGASGQFFATRFFWRVLRRKPA